MIEFSPEEAAAKRHAAAAKFWAASPQVVHVKPLTPREHVASAMRDALYGRNELRRKSDEHARAVRADAIYTSSITVELATRSMIARSM